jgi:uncharacterized RDD family membrane protein YckC
MTDHQLSYCSICTKKHFDAQDGITCSLTGRKPDFTGACPTFDPMAGADVSLVGKPRPFVPESVGLGKRFVHLAIDAVVYYILIMVMSFTLFVLLSIALPDLAESLISEDGRTPFWAYVYSFAIYILYYTLMEAWLGRTFGKMVTGSRVVDDQGRKPSMEIAFKRSISRLVPFEGFSFLGSEPRGWHDKWTDTYVVPMGPRKDIFTK